MDRQSIIKQLQDVFDTVTDGRLDTSTIREDAELVQDLGLTSLELLELRFELESVWNVAINVEEQAQQLRTVGDVISLILARSA